MASTFDEAERAELLEADRVELLEALAHQRSSVRSIVDRLDEEAWHTSFVPSGWTPAGLVVHLGDAERHWTGVIVDHDPGHPFDEERVFDRNAAFVTDWPSTKVLAYYQDQTNRTDGTLAVTALAAAPLGHHGGSYEPRSVRAIVLHLIEETAAHSGHLEIARELIDGSTGLGLR